MIEANVIADSISPQNKRLTTFKLRYPKFIHGECMTHRVFSRNASSSRAVPVAKNIEEVRSDALRAAPVHWGAEQKGMQSGGELDDADLKYIGPNGDAVSLRSTVMYMWASSACEAARRASFLAEAGVHKSIVNRILEPYLHINVVVTATEYGNFFGLRLDKAAQPEMRVLAEAMWRALGESNPKLLQPGEWHLPFVQWNIEKIPGKTQEDIDIACKVSVARCARVSYESFETGKRSTVEEDLKLCERLAASGHWSPFEHQATPDEPRPADRLVKLSPNDRPGDAGWAEWCLRNDWLRPYEHGNFVGWRQYRKMMTGESVASLPEEYR